jgi:hypothetical protein
MQAQLWMSGRCFDCGVERIEHTADGWVVKTSARRYFRLDAASVVLLRRLMRLRALDEHDPGHARAVGFLHHKLLPLGIYTLRGSEAAAQRATSTTGAMRWQRQLLAARHVRSLAAVLAPLFAPWTLAGVMALCLGMHATYALLTAQQIGYHELLSYTPSELLLLVVVCVGRSLVHELGHAAACLRLAGSVGGIGYGVFITTPVLYCDVSDVHLLPRRAKALVGMAGTVLDIVFLALLIAVAGANLIVMKIYWLGVIAVLLNLVPFYRNDGYWVMNDLAGSDDLLERSLHAVTRGRARLADWALLVFMAACLMAMLALTTGFALKFGPEQAAEAVRLWPTFSGVLLALITALQYAAGVFGVLTAAKLLRVRRCE